MRTFFLTIHLMVISFCTMNPAFAWSFGKTESYACFRGSSQTPIKVTIYEKGVIAITFDQYPVTYDFITHNGDTGRLVAGGIWIRSEFQAQDAEKIDKLFRGDRSDLKWIQTTMVIFDTKTKIISYSEIGEAGFDFQMRCVSL